MVKKQKNNLYKLQLPFSIWHKKTIFAQGNESANLIQDQRVQLRSLRKKALKIQAYLRGDIGINIII